MVLGQDVWDETSQRPLTEVIKERFRDTRIIPPLTSESFLRSSSLAGLCPREEVLCGLLNVTRKEEISPDLNTIFSLGAGMHWALQNKILPEIGVLIGRWSCVDCGASMGGHVPGKPLQDTLILRPDHCLACGQEELVYRELYFRNEEYRIGGHPDGFVRVPHRPDPGVLEAKSIAQFASFEVKGAPKMDHVVQSQIYLWFTGLQWSVILYWVKGLNGVEGFIEHFVERDEETIAAVQTAIKSIWAGLLPGGSLPPRICAKADCVRAQACSVSTPCFKEKA